MGQARDMYTFFGHLKWTPAIAAGYATSIATHIMNNHPFIGGNKRVAFFSTDIFLRLNGYKMKVKSKAAHTFLMKLFETNTCDLEHLTP